MPSNIIPFSRHGLAWTIRPCSCHLPLKDRAFFKPATALSILSFIMLCIVLLANFQCIFQARLSRFSRVRLCVTPEMVAHQAPPSLRFSRQEHCSGLPLPSPSFKGDLLFEKRMLHLPRASILDTLIEWVNESWNYFLTLQRLSTTATLTTSGLLKGRVGPFIFWTPIAPNIFNTCRICYFIVNGYILIPSTGPVALCNHTDFLESVRKDFLKKKWIFLCFSVCSYTD